MISYFLLLQLSTLIFWWILWFLYFPPQKYVDGRSEHTGSRFAGHDSSKVTFIRGCVLMLFLSSFVGWALRAYTYYWPQATISSSEAFLYIGPEKGFPKRAVMHEGEKVVIEQKKEQWYYVSSSQGKGWLQATDVALEGDA